MRAKPARPKQSNYQLGGWSPIGEFAVAQVEVETAAAAPGNKTAAATLTNTSSIVTEVKG